MPFRFSPQAAEDIIDLYLEGQRLFGESQADVYHAGLKETLSVLASFPRLGRERRELNRPVRIHPHASHLIVYVIEDDGILVLRVRHGRENWDSAFQ